LSSRRLVDLHTHSTASDGACSPADLVRLADQAKLAAIALTDHDTIAGLAQAREAAQAFPELTFVPGIEISAICRTGTLHLLGLGLDVKSHKLQELMASLQAARLQRDPIMIAKLQALGLDITMDDVRAAATELSAGDKAPGGKASTGVIGRVHFAEALRRKGYIRTVPEAFERYIGDGGVAYVDKERLTPADAIVGIHAAGGLAVLAHPVSLGFENRLQLDRMVRELKQAGLDGIEAYHSDHDDVLTRIILDMARSLGLGVTGGSDFHGRVKPTVRLGIPHVPLAAINERFRVHLGL